MLDPLTFAVKLNHAATVATMCTAGIAVHSMMRTLKGEQTLLGLPFHRRSEDVHDHPDVIAKGPRWTDHYGKRAHDVDVEHLR